MTRNTSLALVVVALLAAAAGVVFLLGGPGAIFGRGDTNVDGDASKAPEKAAARPPEESARTPETAKPGEAVLFGRAKAQRKGVGTVSVRALHWKGETPVVEAAVSLKGVGNGDERVDRTEKTSALGKASFSDVPAGDGYVLRVEAAGEPPTVLPGVDVESGKSRDIVVYVGKRSALFGRVVDEEDKPVAGAEVRAFSGYEGLFEMVANFVDMLGSLDREPVALAKAESDAKGEFTIPDLPPGPLVLRANAAGKRQAVLQVKLSPEGPVGGPPKIVMEAGVAVAGVVVDAAGPPIAGARVSLMAEDSSDPTSVFLGRTFTSTDDRGAFRARVGEDVKRLRAFVAATGYPTTVSKSFRPGDEDVRIVLAGGVTVEISVVEAESGAPIPGASVMFGVSSGEGDASMSAGGGMVSATTDDRGTAVVQAPPGAIEMAIVTASGYAGGMVAPRQSAGAANPFGIVQSDLPARLEVGKTARATFRLGGGWTMKGRVLDPAGAGIVDAEVRAAGMMGLGGAPVSTKSDSQGRYRLVGVTSAAMLVTVRAAGFVQRASDRLASLTGKFAAMGAGKKAETPKPGSEVEQDFTLYPSVTVRGRVVDDKGEPVAGAQVSLADAGMGLSMLFGGGKDSEVTTAADGSYVLSDVDATAGGGAEAMMAAVAPPGRDGEPAPAPAASVKGKLTLSARADGFVSGKSETFEVEGGVTVTAPTIRLGRGASLVGHVRDVGGGAISGAKVEVSKAPADADAMQAFRDMMAGGKAQTLRAGADGSFRLDTLPKGTVTLTATADGYAAARRTVKIEDDAAKAASAQDVEIRLPRGQALAGRVVGRDGRPVAKARVTVTGPESGGEDAYVAPLEATTKDDGTYSLSPLPPGRVKATVRATGKKSTDVLLATGGTAPDVVLEDPSGTDADRLAEVKKELIDVRKRFLDAKTTDEKTALQQRMMELMQEQTRLEGGGGGEGGGDK